MKTILVVDDDECIRETLGELFDQEGYAVFQAQNGAEAIRILQRMPKPEVILLDQNMPVMCGEEFLAKRSEDPRLLAIPVILMSAARPTSALAASVQFLPKPFEISRILEMVERTASPALRGAPAGVY